MAGSSPRVASSSPMALFLVECLVPVRLIAGGLRHTWLLCWVLWSVISNISFLRIPETFYLTTGK